MFSYIFSLENPPISLSLSSCMYIYVCMSVCGGVQRDAQVKANNGDKMRGINRSSDLKLTVEIRRNLTRHVKSHMFHYL